ncbi:MAG TPA: divergent polysaccharide deacetylase family protein [Candidatus Cybelea sp.]|nr:divergent polysaccharide deacetylase family protein [Candidatus Cybelea sp.]
MTETPDDTGPGANEPGAARSDPRQDLRPGERSAPPPSRRGPRGPLIAGFLLLILLASLASWLQWTYREPAAVPASEIAVVVPLPPVAPQQEAPRENAPPPPALAPLEPKTVVSPGDSPQLPAAAPEPSVPPPARSETAAPTQLAEATPPATKPEATAVPQAKPGTAAPPPQAKIEAAAPTARVEAAPPLPRKPAPGQQVVAALGPVPDPALVQRSPHGSLPVIAPDGRQAWRVYAKPFEDLKNRPRIAILLGDMGLSAPATNAAIKELPAPVTLAFAPYAGDLQNWISAARAAGHECMLQLPMEPMDYPANDPGPQALLTSLTAADNIDRLEWLLGRVTGYTGVTNYMGSKFTTSPNDLRPVLEALKSRGMLFVDSRASPRSVAAEMAKNIGLPEAVNNRFLDNEASRAAIDARLAELERIAHATGTAVGIGYPYPVTIERIAAWAPGLSDRGIALAPVSAVVGRQALE